MSKVFTRRSLVASGVAALGAYGMAARAAVTPITIYDDALSADWQNWSWGSEVEMSVPAGPVKPMKVSGTPWSALVLHRNTPLSLSGYKQLSFYINGGLEGGQTLSVKGKTGETMYESKFMIAPKAKTWSLVYAPLKDMGCEDKTITDIVFQAQADAIKAYYITKIVLE